jgi:hypothetical protein
MMSRCQQIDRADDVRQYRTGTHVYYRIIEQKFSFPGLPVMVLPERDQPARLPGFSRRDISARFGERNVAGAPARTPERQAIVLIL